MAQFSSMQNYAPAQQAQQLSYMFQQNSRVQAESTRSMNSCIPNMQMQAPLAGFVSAPPAFGKGAGKGMFEAAPPAFMEMGVGTMAEIPEAKKCIGQVVLDWEFIHDLDLHLLKVNQPGRSGTSGYPTEPNPEPAPEPSLDLNAFVESDASGQRLRRNVQLESIVSYRSKVYNPSGAHTPEAVLQVDRNAAVHSLKPVENLYLTETLQPGAYVVGVHNYALRQLNSNVIGTSASHEHKTFDDFKKMDPGYQRMERALQEQNAHACDPDGTPEKQAIMAQVDNEMNAGSQMIQSKCNSGTNDSGVHYGITLYSYPTRWEVNEKHPQDASFEELENVFQTGFFATADFVFDPDANTHGYNGANVVANIHSEEGKLALGHQKAAHVAILKIVKDADSGKSKMSEVIMLDGRPRANLSEQGGAPSVMNAFRTQRMTQQSSTSSVFGSVGRRTQPQEPFPEPQLQQMPMQMAQFQMQQPCPTVPMTQIPMRPPRFVASSQQVRT